MEFKCSECGGTVIKKRNKVVCTKCGREKIFKKKHRIIKEIDMNDKTKDYNNILFG